MNKFLLFFSLAISFCYGQVTVTPYSVDKFPDMATQIKPYMKGFEHDAIVMTNNSAKDITAIVVVWSYKSIQNGGSPRNVTRSFNNYHFPKQSFHAAIEAHSSTLLAPSCERLHEICRCA